MVPNYPGNNYFGASGHADYYMIMRPAEITATFMTLQFSDLMFGS